MRTILRSVLTGVLAVACGLSAPAAASSIDGPSFKQLREALLTAEELPGGMRLVGDDQARGGDSDFAAWDRCDNESSKAADNVRMISVGYRKGDRHVGMFLGAPGAEEALAIVAAKLDGARRCPSTDPEDLPVTQWVHPRLGDASLVFGHTAIIAQGDVLLYFSTRGIDDAGFAALAEASARKLAKHFPSS
ncbi:hypothetical protein [Actinoplanes xinjiangensis]|uniref:hypothetical protein n=1 Tax=Actinoplanes xinjiangensis TaxID=512350 RepID=UPI0011B65CC8|nr:hypothetical protein [Actinoplanes xinjiangensis]